jgi:hypothetical protein
MTNPTPTRPTPTLAIVRGRGRSPNVVRSTITHSGTDAMTSAARPDGASRSATVSSPIPPTRMSNPSVPRTQLRADRSAAALGRRAPGVCRRERARPARIGARRRAAAARPRPSRGWLDTRRSSERPARRATRQSAALTPRDRFYWKGESRGRRLIKEREPPRQPVPNGPGLQCGPRPRRDASRSRRYRSLAAATQSTLDRAGIDFGNVR